MSNRNEEPDESQTEENGPESLDLETPRYETIEKSGDQGDLETRDRSDQPADED